jgi:hypothetical protein
MCRHDAIAPHAEHRDQCARSFAKWRELYESLENISV